MTISSDLWEKVKNNLLNQEIGTNIYTLLYTKQITNKDLLYSIGNSTQCPVVTYKGKESEEGQTYVYV